MTFSSTVEISLPASMTRITASASFIEVSAALTIYSPRLFFGRCIPGVSKKTNCESSLVRMPVMRFRVVWGLLETMATFSPSMALSRVDFPTLGRPTMAIKPVFFIFRFLPFVLGSLTSPRGPYPPGYRSDGDAYRPPCRRLPRGRSPKGGASNVRRGRRPLSQSYVRIPRPARRPSLRK